MQTAQRIVSGYRRRRFTLCLILAVSVFFLTLCIRFISERNLIEQRITAFNQHAVSNVETLLAPIKQVQLKMSQSFTTVCHDNEQLMREQIARLQTIRSISLVHDGVLYCSSVFGQRNILINHLHPRLPVANPLLFLSTDKLINKGSPILVSWYPQPNNPTSGVLQVININVLTAFMQDSEKPWIEKTVLNVADSHFDYSQGLVNAILMEPGQVRHDVASTLHPFSITTLGPSVNSLAFNSLPGQLPLALILSMLTAYIAWLVTATRMSFSREINLGLSAREFTVFCQPLINTANRQCMGIELLLRWHNPRQGWISPDLFIPLAEQQKLIAPLTRFVLQEAVKSLPLLPQSRDFHIGLNVAACHFEDNAIIDDLRRYWFSTHPQQQLIVELTERDALPRVAHRVIRDLNQLGIKLAIDDFGTGQTSLAYLETLSPDILKIDKSFTAAIGTDAVNSKVIDIIIALGHRLNITLIAEGVETEEQATFLRNNNVSYCQGYYYALPMPLSQFPRWLEGQNASPLPR